METQINVQDLNQLNILLKKIYFDRLKASKSEVVNKIDSKFLGLSIESGTMTIKFNVKISANLMEVVCFEEFYTTPKKLKSERSLSVVFDSKEVIAYT